MKRISQLPAVSSSLGSRSCSWTYISLLNQRCLHTTITKAATVAPITASGPPPSAPIASAEHADSRVARRRKQAELLKRGQDLRSIAAGTGGGTAKLKRFWNDVHVKHADGRLLPASHIATSDLRSTC
jgi:ATP synthase F1 complex assembly factor 2